MTVNNSYNIWLQPTVAETLTVTAKVTETLTGTVTLTVTAKVTETLIEKLTVTVNDH